MIRLHLITEHDEFAKRFLFELLEERPKFANISHKKMPTLGEHFNFVNHHPYAKWYLMMDVNGAPVGSIYLTKTREVGVAVKNGHQRKGHARAAISQLRTIHPGPMYANVAPNNGPSHSLFKKLGGKVIQYTYEL